MPSVRAHVEDLSSMPAFEMLARREAAEKEITNLLGQLVFAYSRFVTGLHLCVAWHDDGKGINNYGDFAEDLSASDLLKSIDKQTHSKLGKNSPGFKKYKAWLRQAHQLRETRNTIMHSRWSIEPYGRHAIAVSTPIFVQPATEHIFTATQLRDLCDTSEKLINQLNKLRNEYPL